MIYRFICPACGKKKEIEMKISEYTAEGHKCDCGEFLQRDTSDFCTYSSRNIEGFFGISKKN